MVKVRLVQVESNESESVEARVGRVLAELPTHMAAADLVVLPELWHVGAFNLTGVRESAEAADGHLVTRLAETARVTRTWLHGGSIAISTAHGKAHNQAFIFNSEGEIAATYSKRHLFGFADGERTVIDSGSEFVTLETPVGRAGLATCYDLRFPEMFRTLLDNGAETFLMCSGWPTPRIGHWQVLTQARAIENQAFMIACNGRGTAGGVTLGGNSVVVGPRGEIIAQASADDEFIDAEIDVAAVAEWRAAFPVLADRRQ
jgi:predicted amidohydrolase